LNVLLTCAGRRNYLVGYFQKALDGRGSVLAADASADASSLYEADKAFVVPLVSDQGYVDALLEICRKNHVRLLVPLNDLELSVIASRRSDFVAIGTLPLVSSPHVIDICFDKWKTAAFLQEIGLKTPKTYLTLEDALTAVSAGEISYPLVVKPRWGSASIGLGFPADSEELEMTYELTRKRLARSILAEASSTDTTHSILIQEMLSGSEYGLDVVNDINGNHVCVFVKQKLAMRSGEADRARTITNDKLEAIGATIAKALGHIGNLDCDMFVGKEGFATLELNPRFGGGYPFSHAAGADLPAALIAWVNGVEPDPDWLLVKPNVVASKCDRLVIRDDQPINANRELVGSSSIQCTV
jgi:carbamoyl-phosphate synthase large subunit